MIRRCSFIAALLLFGGAPSQAIILDFLNDDTKDQYKNGAMALRLETLRNPTGERFRRQRQRLDALRVRLLGLEKSQIVTLFGPALKPFPKSRAFSIYEYRKRAMSGIGSLDAKTGQLRIDSMTDKGTYALGGFAFVTVTYGRGGQNPSYVCFYNHQDSTYPPAFTWRDLRARMAWDDARLARLEAHLNARLPPEAPSKR